MEEINMRVLENCEPKQVFYYFEEICKIPHGSRNTKQISDYLVAFAKEHGFDYVQDEMNNVIIYKPATPGYEKHQPLFCKVIWTWFARKDPMYSMTSKKTD